MVSTFIALGDSFTEGLHDPGPGGEYRGWADRFAEILAARNGGLQYANLAVRGKMLGEVVDDQLPAALAMAPDLVSIAAGGNDLLRPSADPDSLAEVFEAAVIRLRDAGCQVLVLTGFDPRTFPVIRWIRGKVAVYNMHLRAIADRRGAVVVDLWSMPVLCDPRVWSDDRLHLTAEGHRRVALRACEAFGLLSAPDPANLDAADADWRAPLAAVSLNGGVGRAVGAGGSRAGWLAARRVDARWARDHAAPWVHRRVRGVSTGDGREPKRPALLPIELQSAGAVAQVGQDLLKPG
jgi:lysophospholipase L1-like esterase